jgi:hypothetical protein
VRVLKGRKKIVNNFGGARQENRFLKMLRSELVFPVSIVNVAGDAKEDTFKEPRKDFDAALAEAEYQKARGTMATQQARSLC